jgi:hypothetical protein
VREQAVDKAGFLLPEAIGAEYGLGIVAGVPRGIHDHHAIGSVEVDSQTPRASGYQVEPRFLAPVGATECEVNVCSGNGRVCMCVRAHALVEFVDFHLPLIAAGAAVNPKIVQSILPLASSALGIDQTVALFLGTSQHVLNQVENQQTLREEQHFVSNRIGLLEELAEK